MEHSSVALFQILYQNETLFQLADRVLPELSAIEATEQTAPPVPEAVQAPVPSLPATPAVPVPPPALPQAPAAAPPASAPTPVPAFPSLQHKVLVLTDESKQQEMLMSEALFLDNILKAVGHSLETSDVLNFSFMPGQDARTVLSGKKPTSLSPSACR
jgi:hypothetical protein